MLWERRSNSPWDGLSSEPIYVGRGLEIARCTQVPGRDQVPIQRRSPSLPPSSGPEAEAETCAPLQGRQGSGWLATMYLYCGVYRVARTRPGLVIRRARQPTSLGDVSPAMRPSDRSRSRRWGPPTVTNAQYEKTSAPAPALLIGKPPFPPNFTRSTPPQPWPDSRLRAVLLYLP